MKHICLAAPLIALTATTILAQGKSGEGTMTLSKKSYQLKSAIAYETTVGDEEQVVVALTGSPMSGEKLKKALATEKSGGFAEFPPPYLKIYFKKDGGQMRNYTAVGGGTTVAGASDGTGELKLENGHAVGQANAPLDSSALIPKGFDVHFDAAMTGSADEVPASTAKKYGPAANVKPSVTGTFTGNGKPANLKYVSARWTEPFDDKTGISLVFTEKDHSKDKKPDNDAMFGKYGDALIISTHEDGSIYSCQVVHSGMKTKGFSSSGSIEATPFTYDNGKVEGELTTNGPVDTFDEKWEVKLKFVAPLGEIPKEYQVAEERPVANPSKESNQEDAASKSGDPSEMLAAAMAKVNAGTGVHNQKPTQPQAAGPEAKELALTKDATDVDYKALVDQIDFKSKLGVKAACSDLSANLKKQGWMKDGDDLITPASSILKRKHGQANLTIFVKPGDGGGSEIKMMTEGLTWEKD